MIVAEVETRSEVSPAKLQQLLEKRGITLNNSPAALMAFTAPCIRRRRWMSLRAALCRRAKAHPVADAAAKDAAKDTYAKAGAGNSRAVAKNANPPPPKSISPPETPAPTAALKFADSDHEAQETEADKESLEVVYVVGYSAASIGIGR